MENQTPMNQMPQDTNGQWQRVKGSDVARQGDYVPLQGFKGAGAANVYFDGAVNNKHVETEIKSNNKVFVNSGCICIILAILCMIVGIEGFIPTIFGVLACIGLGIVGAILFVVGLLKQ